MVPEWRWQGSAASVHTLVIGISPFPPLPPPFLQKDSSKGTILFDHLIQLVVGRTKWRIPLLMIFLGLSLQTTLILFFYIAWFLPIATIIIIRLYYVYIVGYLISCLIWKNPSPLNRHNPTRNIRDWIWQGRILSGWIHRHIHIPW